MPGPDVAKREVQPHLVRRTGDKRYQVRMSARDHRLDRVGQLRRDLRGRESQAVTAENGRTLDTIYPFIC
jgi:hypothetical protein